MKNIWEVWPAILSAADCDAVIEKAQQYPIQSATVGFDEAQRDDQAYRSSIIRWLDPDNEADLVKTLMRYVQASNRTNFGIDIVAPFDLQFTEYHGTAHGKYDWHHDVWLDSPRPYARKLSFVLQLSEPDDYEGGAFEFFGLQQPGATFAPRGSLLIFPSFLQHRVLPVTKGVRRSLVSWVEGPRWR